MRTKLDVNTAHVDRIAGILSKAITQRTVRFFMRQHAIKPMEIIVSCANSSRVDRALNKLDDEGYDYGPKPSADVLVKEGQVLSLRFRGNLLPESDVFQDVLLFNSHLPCRAHFRIRIVDKFAQKSLETYRGFVQLFTEEMVAQPVPPDEDNREAMRGTSQKTQPKFVMVPVDKLVKELLITLPKPDPMPPRPLITAPLCNVADGPVDKDVLLHIAEELGEEWIKLAGYLNVKHSRIQAILRQNANRDNTHKIYDMLLTWSKRLPRCIDRVEILSRGLQQFGRYDLAEELRDRRNEFRQQRAHSSKDSYMRKAFVRVARDQNVITDWQSLALKLGLSRTEVDEIERERPTSQDRCFSSLQRWKDQNGDDATLITLSKGLKTCKHRGLAREIESIV